MTYVISDIHGEYDMFEELLGKIRFCDRDRLFVLGDMIDRGPDPIKVVRKLMAMPNAVCLAGNHELMAMECLGFLMREITESTLGELNEDMLDRILTWQYNGSKTTIEAFRKLDKQGRNEVLEFLEDLSVYEEVSIGENNFILVHAGLGNFSPEKSLEEYSLEELVWERPDYGKQYFNDRYVVAGHTPTQTIEENPRPGFVYRANNHIAIDCGACFEGGRLAALCLETEEAFYSSENKA